MNCAKRKRGDQHWKKMGMMMAMVVMVMTTAIHQTSADISTLLQLTARSLGDGHEEAAQLLQERPERAALEPPTVTSLKPPQRSKGSRQATGRFSVQGDFTGSYIPPVVASRSPSSSSNSKDYKTRYMHINTRHRQPLSPVATASSESKAGTSGADHSAHDKHHSVPVTTPHITNGTTVSIPQESSWVPPMSYAPSTPIDQFGSPSRNYPRHRSRIHPQSRAPFPGGNPYNGGGVWRETGDRPISGLQENARYPSFPHPREYGPSIEEEPSRTDTFGHRISEDLSHLSSRYPLRRGSSRGKPVLHPFQSGDVYNPSRGTRLQEEDIHIINQKGEPSGSSTPRITDQVHGEDVPPTIGEEAMDSTKSFGIAPATHGSSFRGNRTSSSRRDPYPSPIPPPIPGDVDDVTELVHPSIPKGARTEEDEIVRHSGSKRKERRKKKKKRDRKRKNRRRGERKRQQSILEVLDTTVISPQNISKNGSMSQISENEPIDIQSVLIHSEVPTLISDHKVTEPFFPSQPDPTQYVNETISHKEPGISQLSTQEIPVELSTIEERHNSSQHHAIVVEATLSTMIKNGTTKEQEEHVLLRPEITSHTSTTQSELTRDVTVKSVLSPVSPTEISFMLPEEPTSERITTTVLTPTMKTTTSLVPRAGSLTLPPSNKPSEVSIVSLTVIKVPDQETQGQTRLEDITLNRGRKNHRSSHRKQNRSKHHQRSSNKPKVLSSVKPRTMEDDLMVRNPFLREESREKYTFPVRGFMILTGIMGALAVFTLVVLLSYAIVKCSKHPVVNNYQVSEQTPGAK